MRNSHIVKINDLPTAALADRKGKKGTEKTSIMHRESSKYNSILTSSIDAVAQISIANIFGY